MPAPMLIAEDGSGMSTANSYIDVAGAQAYYQARLYGDAWNNADSDQKTIALIMATKFIDSNMSWYGYRTTTTQALDWPRMYVPDKRYSPADWNYNPLAPWNEYGVVYPQNEIPKVLKDATAEMAGELLKTDRTAEWDAMGVDAVSLGQGALSVDFAQGAESLRRLFTQAVMDFLDPLGTPKGQLTQARVYRGG